MNLAQNLNLGVCVSKNLNLAKILNLGVRLTKVLRSAKSRIHDFGLPKSSNEDIAAPNSWRLLKSWI